MIGDLLCVLAGAFYVLYLLPAQSARETMGQWSVLAVVCASAAPVLLVIALLLGEPVWPGSAGWTPVLGLALSSQIIGQGLLVYALLGLTTDALVRALERRVLRWRTR